MRFKRIPVFQCCVAICAAFLTVPALAEEVTSTESDEVVTLLFTNDFESVYDPIEAFWLEDVERIGGLAQLSTMIGQIREEEPDLFLFDAGDIFTGALAKLTNGRLSFELMITMDYDAMAIGNHEFEYGEQVLQWEKNRVPFPVLGANLFYKDTDHPFAQPHAIIERDGVRIGVIGIMGQDAATAIIPSFIDDLDVIEPAIAVRRSVEALRDEVDLIVVLTHQGKTAPMQTDAESDPRLDRGVAADIALAGAVPGIDVIFGGHSDAGTPKPVIHPDTGTIIMQTYGQGTHLGILRVALDRVNGGITSYNGELLPVVSHELEPDRRIAEKIQAYRARFPELREPVGRTSKIMFRRYIEESTLGNLFADIYREAAGADIGFVHSGSLRKDLSGGVVSRVDLLDVYPFVDSVVKVRLTGAQLREVLEQSLTLERGLLQASGLWLEYDLSRPIGDRLVDLRVGGQEIGDDATVTVAVAGFLAEGGDLYSTFPEGETVEVFGKVSDEVIDYFAKSDLIEPPALGRQVASGGQPPSAQTIAKR
ncbi:MAG: bifunctional UDP-sugar hydrolase/5'-nucleotidase [Pseudomonadota bacterium]